MAKAGKETGQKAGKARTSRVAVWIAREILRSVCAFISVASRLLPVLRAQDARNG
jgi:hypothetical protein